VFKKLYSNNEIRGILLASFLLGIILSVPFATNAILVTSPPRSIQAGDVSTGSILDGTIINADVSGSALITPDKLASTGTAGVLYYSSGSAFSTTTNLLWDNSTARLGIGSTTPNYNVSVEGTGYFSGGMTTGNLYATGTTAFNKIAYTWPASDGADTNVLQTDGNGSLAWGSAGDWLQIGEFVQNTASTSLRLTGLDAKRDLRVVINSSGYSSASGEISLRFNGDRSNSYGCTWYKNTNETVGNHDRTGCLMASATTTNFTFIIDITNGTTTRKHLSYTYITSNGDFAGVKWDDGVGVWNSLSQITDIWLYQSDMAGTYPAGTRMTIYGKAN
jgi:hypothetical protein